MYIEGMSSFRAQSMDFQLDIYFQERWIDERLAHNNSKRILVKDPHLFNMIWHPDLYFANARTADFHHVTSPNFLVWIYPNGTVWYDCRISMTVICMLSLRRYPLDSQRCTLRILSYAYDVDQLVVEWSSEGAADSNSEIRMPDMKLREIIPASRNDTYATGIWSCATAEFIMDRELMHHIIQSYMPTALIVIISWFSFWLDVEAVPGRVSLSITTLLTLATQNSAARMELPQASYVKAIDVWMGACMAFVFAAMIEFTFVNYSTRRKPRVKIKNRAQEMSLSEQVHKLVSNYSQQKPLHQAQSELSNEPLDPRIENRDFEQNAALRSIYIQDHKKIREKPTFLRRLTQDSPLFGKRTVLTNGDLFDTKKQSKVEERLVRVEENRKVAQAIDRNSRVYFPLAFLIFNLVYWVYYLRFANDDL
uniref:Uncharacterized protein n=1 Tax=Acrobeloides nanus TaxID=290746 RepID=A0A914CZU1_9BILA